MTAASAPPAAEPTPDPRRHPAALAQAISNAWRPYRWRGHAVGILAGMVIGGIAAPIATTTALMSLYLIGAPSLDRVAWEEAAWTVAFALTLPIAGATAFARWQPERLRMAAQTYLWLAMRAEANWARLFGARPVPRDERRTRAALASIPETPETAGQRAGLWISLLEIDRARAAVAEMPEATARDRHGRASAAWLIDFVAGTTRRLEPLEPLVEAIEDPDARLEAAIEGAVSRARVELSEGRDWQAPLAAARGHLGAAPDATYRRHVWVPVFRMQVTSTAIAVTVFWLALRGLAP